MKQRPESVGANGGQRGVDGGDGLLDDMALALLVERRRQCFVGSYAPASACPLCTHSSVLSWPVCGMPRKVDL